MTKAFKTSATAVSFIAGACVHNDLNYARYMSAEESARRLGRRNLSIYATAAGPAWRHTACFTETNTNPISPAYMTQTVVQEHKLLQGDVQDKYLNENIAKNAYMRVQRHNLWGDRTERVAMKGGDTKHRFVAIKLYIDVRGF